VTITGSNFTGATDVTLYFRPASFAVVNDTTITATVPPDVPGPGKWRVTTPNGMGQSSAQYVPTSPAVTGFTPTSGPPGTQVTLTGINLTGASQVTVYFVNASFVANSPTSITVTIPAGMPGPGRFRVTTPNGLATSTDQFTPTAGSGGPASMPVISRGAPAFASSQLYPAADANDSDYTSYWRGSIPGWIAYDLSKVPAGQRGKVLVAWYNDPITSPYDHTVTGEVAYNSLKSYTIQANAAAGGTSAPSSGWVTLATITGNVYHSRTALVDMTGYNWIRLNVTAADGSSGNTDAMFNLDVHDASQGVSDSWIFYGDSITQDGTYHEPVGPGNVGNFSQLINAAKADHFPAYEDAGIGGLQSSDGAQNIAKWLALFPGKYVALSYGTNDANGCGDTTAFYDNYVTMVTAVLNAGKVPVVPTIPWARTSDVQKCGPGFVAKIQALYAAYPQVVKGPDLWSYFKSNQSLISGDNLHPSAAGYAAFRQQWANAMLANVYGGS
jgi:lysophospholipase L1-like esterase